MLCYGRTQFIDLAGVRLGMYPEDFSADSGSPLERYRRVRKHLNLCTPLQAGVIRRDALRRCRYLGNYRDSDRVLIAGLALEGRIVLLPQVHFYRRWGEAVATPLRTALEVEQMYRPEAQRTPMPLFANLPRHLGQLGIALRTPRRLAREGAQPDRRTAQHRLAAQAARRRAGHYRAAAAFASESHCTAGFQSLNMPFLFFFHAHRCSS